MTGLGAPALPTGRIGTLLVDGVGGWMVTTPELSFGQTPNGTGDVLAALYFGRRLRGEAPPDALSLGVSGLYTALELAQAENLRELPLVKAQDQVTKPDVVFAAVPI